MTGISAMNDEGVKILIVDDQPRNLDALEVMLESWSAGVAPRNTNSPGTFSA